METHIEHGYVKITYTTPTPLLIYTKRKDDTREACQDVKCIINCKFEQNKNLID